MSVTENGVSELYVGRVLGRVSREERVMSDVYAQVSYAQVVEANGETREIHLRSHFECCASTRWAEMDATPEWRAYAAAYSHLAKATASYVKAVAKVEGIEKWTVPTMEPKKGSYVMVDRGSKGAKKGASGEVFYVGTCRFSGKPRIGFKGADGVAQWSAAGSVSVVPTVEELEAHEALAAADKAAALTVARAELAERSAAAQLALSQYLAAQAAVAAPMAVAA